MIKVVVFDLGGVLFSEGKSVAIDTLSRKHGYPRELLQKLLSSPESIKLRKGLMSDESFWSWVQKQLPEGCDAALVKKEWYDGYVLDEDIRALVKELKGKYKLIAFSGNVQSRVQFLEKKYGFRHLFDVEIYSFDYHCTKPDKQFVEIMIEKAGCKPEEILYIEDNEGYAKPARELGAQVLIYTRGEAATLRSNLREQGVLL